MKRLLERPGLVFLLIFLWRAVLLLTTAQPIPANDAYFYDGPVVHFLNHGGYFNPAVAQSRPISGTEVFCAYPPFYQLTLLAWMTLAGTSVLAAMTFHLCLFGAYQLVVLALFRRLKVPACGASLAGLFLIVITFDDRPDGLASLLGTLGVYAVVRTLAGSPGWTWLAATCSICALATSLQIGALYSAWIFLTLLAGWKIIRTPFPSGALAAMIFIPPALVAAVRFGFPHLWTGFLENVHGNASLTGARVPTFNELLKAGRNLGAIFIIAAFVLATGRHHWREIKKWRPEEIVFYGGLALGLAFIAACLSVVAANWMGVINYFQPILAGLFLAAIIKRQPEMLRTRALAAIVILVLGLGSVRAIGLTTWGVACATDVSCATALRRVASELDSMPPQSTGLLSAAYLYEADRHTNGIWIHEDYAPQCEAVENFPQALRRLRATKLVLTPFDYYRRYQRVLETLRAEGGAHITVTETFHLRPPDSYPGFQQVLQHVSWAPVIVDLQWKK